MSDKQTTEPTSADWAEEARKWSALATRAKKPEDKDHFSSIAADCMKAAEMLAQAERHEKNAAEIGDALKLMEGLNG